jgi:hypothetical protein
MKNMSMKLLALGLLLLSFDGFSQALRIVGYEGEVVLTNGVREPVSGATQAACEADFASTLARLDPTGTIGLYHGRNGTQPCVPRFIFRSPTAPSFELPPGVVLWPEIPVPPVCLSCPWLEDLKIVEQIYPDHVNDVAEYIQAFKIDQYNMELRDLQERYQHNIKQFEHKMYELDKHVNDK